MSRLILLILCLFYANSAFSIKNLKTDFKSSLKASSRNSLTVKKRVLSLVPELKLLYKIDEDLHFKAYVGANLEAGSNDSLYIDEFAPENEVFIKEGKLKYSPFQFIALDFGILNQAQYQSPLFLSDIGFAGVQENLYFKFSNFFLKFHFQQSIPSNQTLSTRIGEVDEGTPRLYSETVSLGFKTDTTFLSVSYTHFAFNNLAGSVAYQSRFMGNSVSGTGLEGANFLYSFKGHSSNINFKLKMNIFRLWAYGQYTHNDEAPTSRSDGYLGGLVIGTTSFQGLVESYRNETDVVPAYYNSSFYGHNNYEGRVFGLKIHNLPKLLEFKFRYIQSSLIEDNLYQADFDAYRLDITKSF
ncbi:MAG: hypothetical protein ACPGJV_00340 [Bacteriovoracaceae bacterium]